MSKIASVCLQILRRLPAILLMCASCYLSSQERVPMPGFQNSDKLVHFVCFGALSLSWSLWFPLESWRKSPVRNAALCVLFTSAYGAIDEFHQSFTPGRCAGADDWLADTAGASLASGLCLAAFKAASRLREHPLQRPPCSDKIER